MQNTEATTETFIVGFLTGRVGDEAYLGELKSGVLLDPLGRWSDAPPFVPDGDARSMLFRDDITTPFGRASTQSLLLLYVQSQGIHDEEAIACVQRTERTFTVLLKAQPSWVDLSGDRLGSQLLENVRQLSTLQQIREIRRSIRERFRHLDERPNWIQSPDWQIRNGIPLTFVGQLSISQLRHDVSDLYVFIDQVTGEVATVEQSM